MENPDKLRGERSETPEMMRCEATSPPILPEPNADPGQFCPARPRKCRQLTTDRSQYISWLEELSATGLTKQNAWTLFRNRVSNCWVWTATTTGVPHEAAVELDNLTEQFFTRSFRVGVMNSTTERRVFHPIREGGVGPPQLQRRPRRPEQPAGQLLYATSCASPARRQRQTC